MYSRKAWGGSLDPFILTKFLRYEPTGEDDPNDDPIVAAIIYEWEDEHLIGVPLSPETGEVPSVLPAAFCID